MDREYSNPLIDPYLTVGGKDIKTDFGTRTGIGGKISVPLLYSGGRGAYTSLRGEGTGFVMPGNRRGISSIESQLGSDNVGNMTAPDDLSAPGVQNISLGVRGIYNTALGNRNKTFLKTNIGAGYGIGEKRGEYTRYNPNHWSLVENVDASEDINVMKPYADANVSLLTRMGQRSGVPGVGGITASYGTQNAPNPGLRGGVTGSIGPVTGNVGYDFTNKSARAGLGITFQTGGFNVSGGGATSMGNMYNTSAISQDAASATQQSLVHRAQNFKVPWWTGPYMQNPWAGFDASKFTSGDPWEIGKTVWSTADAMGAGSALSDFGMSSLGKLKDRFNFQTGGMYDEPKMYDNGGFFNKDNNKLLSLGLKGIKAIPRIAGAAGSRLLGPLGMILGAKSAKASNVINPNTGVNTVTGKQQYTPFNQGVPASWNANVKQTGGMYNQMMQYQQGGLSNKVIQNYENSGISQDILNQLNTTDSDTVLTNIHPDLGEGKWELDQDAMYEGFGKTGDTAVMQNQNSGLFKRFTKYRKPYKKGGELSSRKYKKLLTNLGGNLASDTLVSGSSIDQATAIKKAKFNYNQATNIPFTDQVTKYNKKTGKYTTYYAGPKKNKMGGVALPGGEMNPIPGSDAVEFEGNTHDEGGILLDSQTEVENGETMDKVNIAKKGGKRGSKKDYFFSSYLKMGGKSFADVHKDILAKGGNQNDINMLARMQEKAAGRDPKQVAGLGGVMQYRAGGFQKYQTGGVQEKPVKPRMRDFQNSTEYMKARKKYFKALEVWEANQNEENVSTVEDRNYRMFPFDDNNLGTSDTVTVPVNPKDTIITDDDEDPYYDEFDEEEFEAYLAEEERLENEEKRLEKENKAEALKTRLNEIKKKSKKLDIDYTKFKNKNGKFTSSSLDKAEAEIAEAETNFNDLKTQADELGIKYDNNTSPSDLEYKITEAGHEVQAKGEGTLLADVGNPGIPDKQGKITIGDKEYYMDDPKLQDYIAKQGDKFGPNWMDNLDQDVLDNAGITSFEDFQDPKNVKKYQIEYNKKYPTRSIEEDGLFGEETIRTGIQDDNQDLSDSQINLGEVKVTDDRTLMKKLPFQEVTYISDNSLDSKIPTTLDAVTPPEYTGGTDRFEEAAKEFNYPLETLEDYENAEQNIIYNEDTDEWEDRGGGGTIDVSNIGFNTNVPTFKETNYTDRINRSRIRTDNQPPRKKEFTVPNLAYAGMAAGLGAGLYSIFHKQPKAEQAKYTPGFSPVVAYRGRAPKLERYDYNQDIANVGRDVRGMNRYIETSGGGPANMVNKMMAFSKGQQAKDKIRAAETRANIGVANTEAQLEQQMELDNLRRQQQVSIFNSQMSRAEMARKDQIDEANTARRQKRIDDMEFQKYAGISSIASSIQTGLGDILDYNADMAKAQAIGAGTSVYMDAAKLNQGWTFADDGITLVPPRKFGGLRRLQNYNK